MGITGEQNPYQGSTVTVSHGFPETKDFLEQWDNTVNFGV